MRLLQPLRHRDFRLLWLGMSTSLVGDGVFLVALAWQVYLISNVVGAMAAVGVALTVPQVALLLVGGVVADRFDRRLVLVVSDLVRGGSLVVLAILAAGGGLTLTQTYVLVGIFGAATGFFGPAFDAIVPSLVPPADLEQANALDQFVRPAAARIAGPAGERTIPVSAIATGPGRTSLQAGELLVSLELPAQPQRWAAKYLRFTPRREMDIAIAGAGVWLALNEVGRIADARITLASVAPVPLVADKAVAALVGERPSIGLFTAASTAAAVQSQPISDTRGSADYRRELVAVLTRRGLEDCATQLGLSLA